MQDYIFFANVDSATKAGVEIFFQKLDLFSKPIFGLISCIAIIVGLIILINEMIRSRYAKFLYIDIEIEDKSSEYLFIKTAVENKGKKDKIITYSFLLIGPEHENPVETFNAVLGEEYKFGAKITDHFDIYKFKQLAKNGEKKIAKNHKFGTDMIEVPLQVDKLTNLDLDKAHFESIPQDGGKPSLKTGRAIIPLTFYSHENDDIADEKIGYTKVIKKNCFMNGIPYSVRFYVFGEKELFRSTQTVFVIPKTD